jgi:branched-chain amino acid transport system permease protein
MGISVRTIMALAWAIAFMIATIGGILLGSINGFTPALSEIGLFAIPAAFIGGLDSVPGTIVGGLLIGLVGTLVDGYVGMGAGTPAAFMLLVIVMFFRPYGLWGLVRIERV